MCTAFGAGQPSDWEPLTACLLSQQVVLCKIPGSQFSNMYEVGQATFAHYELEGLPKDPAGFSGSLQDR